MKVSFKRPNGSDIRVEFEAVVDKALARLVTIPVIAITAGAWFVTGRWPF